MCSPQDNTEYRSEESRRIQCTKCGNSHIWVCTNRSKAKARWCQVWFLSFTFWLLNSLFLSKFSIAFSLCVCLNWVVHLLWKQDCCQFHQAKDGDGWVEYKGSLVFDRPQKVDSSQRIIFPASSYIVCISFLNFDLIFIGGDSACFCLCGEQNFWCVRMGYMSGQCTLQTVFLGTCIMHLESWPDLELNLIFQE